MKTVILGCKDDHISIRIRNTDGGKITTHKAKTIEDISDLFKKMDIQEERDVVMCSSSLDFPEEYTNSKEIIKLAKFLRNDNEERPD